MIVVVLDEAKPVTREDISWNTWAGNGRNRWFDKHQRTLCFYPLLIRALIINAPSKSLYTITVALDSSVNIRAWMGLLRCE